MGDRSFAIAQYQYHQDADILISAVGRPALITAEMVKPRAVVIDVGINRITDGEGSRLVGMSTLNLFKVWRNFSPGSWRHWL